MKRLTDDLESIHISDRPLYKPPEFDQPPDPYRIVTTAGDIDGMGIAQFRFAEHRAPHQPGEAARERNC